MMWSKVKVEGNDAVLDNVMMVGDAGEGALDGP